MSAALVPSSKNTSASVPQDSESPAPSGLEIIVPSRDESSAPGWFHARSEAAWAEFQSLPLPSLKDEHWRYSNAKKIELARTLGTLSLSLVGDQEESSKENDPDAITIADLTNSGLEAANPQAQEEVSADGVMYTTDPKTGRQIRYILNRQKKWTQDRTFGEGGQ